MLLEVDCKTGTDDLEVDVYAGSAYLEAASPLLESKDFILLTVNGTDDFTGDRIFETASLAALDSCGSVSEKVRATIAAFFLIT